jgi:RNA polymerase sigma factor (sigma-70 family)
VDRYQGRLLAFARNRGISAADADDLVQETLIRFLGGLATFREEASLETYLFMILRRRIIDWLRGRRVHACLVQDGEGDDPSGVDAAAPDLTASTYARRDEQVDRQRTALAAALSEMIGSMKEAANFRDLQIVEMLFYAQLRNKEISGLSGLSEQNVALMKHRWLKQLRDRVSARLGGIDLEEAGSDSLLTQIWEDGRLSCPKRSTIGGYLLKTLELPWHDYVDFHLEKLGCRFCLANLDDLRSETKQSPRRLKDKVMQSTVGFFRK